MLRKKKDVKKPKETKDQGSEAKRLREEEEERERIGVKILFIFN